MDTVINNSTAYKDKTIVPYKTTNVMH